jgi:acetyl esterase/lipase
VTVGGQPATGLYSLPNGSPRGIVVVGHGFPGTAASEASLVQRIATDDQVIALAMDYRGTDLSNGVGWRVIEGAQDSIAATKLFDNSCPGSAQFTNTVLGISMGGNMSGIAVSSAATRSTGAPLYDYWFDVAGVTDVPEIYTDATAISQVPIGSIQTIGQEAVASMNAEFGGTPVTAPAAYLNNSPVLRTSRMKASGLKGVVISHGVLDGEVTSDMSVQMVSALAATGIHTDLYTSVFKAPGTMPGLTLDGDVLGLIPGYVSPFAGHVNAVVLGAATQRLTQIYNGGPGPSGLSVTLADGDLGTYPLLSVPGA